MKTSDPIMPTHSSLPAPERHVVLVAPEVHWNTGNVGRTCLGANATLHLVRPLGFSLDSRQVKRAGLDYWPRVDLSVWDSFDHFLAGMAAAPEEVCLFAKRGSRSYRVHAPSGAHVFDLRFGDPGASGCGIAALSRRPLPRPHHAGDPQPQSFHGRGHCSL